MNVNGEEEPENDVFGEYNFARVSTGASQGLPYLSSLSFEFQGAEIDPNLARESFDAASHSLKDSLERYRGELQKHQADFAKAFLEGSYDESLLSASDELQESLESLGLAHQGWTGHPFISHAMYRREQHEPQSDEALAAMLEADEAASTDDYQSYGPRLNELGVTVVLDEIVHDDDERMLRLNSATVHSNGVLLSVDGIFLRGPGEAALAWHRRSNDQLGQLDLALELRDPSTGTGYSGEMNGGEGNYESYGYRLSHRFWIHRALEANELRGIFTLVNAVTASGDNKILDIDFTLDTTQLREATTGIRNFSS